MKTTPGNSDTEVIRNLFTFNDTNYHNSYDGFVSLYSDNVKNLTQDFTFWKFFVRFRRLYLIFFLQRLDLLLLTDLYVSRDSGREVYQK